MERRIGPASKLAWGILAVAVCPVVIWAALDQGKWPTLGLTAGLALIVAIYVGLRHPLWLYWGLAVTMGALPFGYVPGVHVPLYLLFTGGTIMAALIHPTATKTLTKLEIAVLLMILLGGLSMVATGMNVFAVLTYGRWAAATMLVIALLRLSRENLEKFGRFFVYAASVNAAAGIVMATVDKQQHLLKPLRIFGYGVGDELRQTTALYVYSQEGASVSQTIRLGGTWVLPNSAGLALAIAIGMALVLLRGWLRTVLVAVMLAAVLLTLSRATLFSLGGAVILVLLFHTMRARDRRIGISAIVLALAAGVCTPAIRKRVLTSFNSDDKGRDDRFRALREFPHQMQDHWIFGLGWGRAEFRSGQAAQTLNYVSNAPLLTIYRGGLVTGLVFIAIMLMGAVMSYRGLRSASLPIAVYGAIFIGLAVVYQNLAQSVVDMPVFTATYSIYLVFTVYVDRLRQDPPPGETHAAPAPQERALASVR